jgi:hypothetical protein
MLLTDARRAARTGPSGELIPLTQQDRRLWDRQAIAEGVELITAALSKGHHPWPRRHCRCSRRRHVEDTDCRILRRLRIVRRNNPMRRSITVATQWFTGRRRDRRVEVEPTSVAAPSLDADGPPVRAAGDHQGPSHYRSPPADDEPPERDYHDSGTRLTRVDTPDTRWSRPVNVPPAQTRRSVA